jgi:ParB-like chromosome segregation protein Spo0J
MEQLQEIGLDAIGMDFERFRLIDPRAESRMVESMRTYGQLSPLFAGMIERKPLLVDGFKRYRAARVLGNPTVQLRCVERPITALKAIALTMHSVESPGSEIEEALLLHSLHREDGLKQNEIALLCNRHKSWVSRRIALISMLSDEVQQQLRVGLLSISTARELLRLPRGNQSTVLQSIQENDLSSRQSRELIGRYMGLRQPWQQQQLLKKPLESLEQQSPRIDCGMFTSVVIWLVRSGSRLAALSAEHGVGSLNKEQRCRMQRVLGQVRTQCDTVISMTTTEDKEICQ